MRLSVLLKMGFLLVVAVGDCEVGCSVGVLGGRSCVLCWRSGWVCVILWVIFGFVV